MAFGAWTGYATRARTVPRKVSGTLARRGVPDGIRYPCSALRELLRSSRCSRQVRDLPLFAETIRQIAVFYDGLVVPGALLLLGSGTWLIVTVYGGWAFLRMPWLVGMVALFAFEFIEGNTITRRYFMRLRRLTRTALEQGAATPDLEKARQEHLPTLTHFLDLPILFVIVALGAMRPNTWALFLVGTILAIVAATGLALAIPRMYPFQGAGKAGA